MSALAATGAQGVRQLAVLAADPASAATSPDIVLAIAWEGYVAEEERRVRGGAPLTRTRVERAVKLGLAAGVSGVALDTAASASGAALDTAASGVALDSALRGDPEARGAALTRALTIAAAIDDRALSDAAAALVLCAEGRTNVIRLLPFGEIDPGARTRALEAWRAKDPAPWQSLALESAAGSARARRVSVEWMLRHAPELEEDALAPLGRAAITARRALHHLRDTFATTVGTLSDALNVSLPAAGDALRRLDEAGLATELTGRRRGRVYAYTAALTIVDAASS